ncbi:hypothetical protein [Companilactobacillus sp. FL22-1]|uniref:hypothetical protein n=1 Tax=Companilactobacillus sp. FL22-1 TaxID=3373892 RepID=UPI00375527D3
MTEKQLDLYPYIDADDLDVNVLYYRTSPVEPIEKDSTATLFSDERRRLTESEDRFQLYNQSGELYVDKVSFDELFEKIIEIRENGLPEIDDNDEDINQDLIMKLVDDLAAKGITVWGNNQGGYDSWDVLDDILLSNAVSDHQKTGQKQLTTVVAADGRTYKIDFGDHQTLVRNPQKSNLSDHDYSDYYEVRDANGSIMVSEVPLRSLALVLLAIDHDFSSQQVKQEFLWPRLSANQVGDSRLVWERNFSSDMKQIKTIQDLNQIKSLTIVEDQDHMIEKYRFVDQTERWIGKIAFPADDLLAVFDNLYYDMRVDSKDVGKSLSDFIIDLGKKNNLMIFRQQQTLLNIRNVKRLLVNPDGSYDLGISKNPEDSKVNFVTNTFALVDQDSRLPYKDNLSIEMLVAYLWRKADK